MADFEELKLTVSLTDSASAGLANIRTQLTQLVATAGQVQTTFANVASSVQQVGNAAQQATPKVSNQERALKELSRSAEETGRGLVQMGLAARRGAEAFPELALATREAWTGLKGVSAGMAELGATSRLMVVGLGSVALGVAAVGAAVAAYGISVFKFSREMYTLSQTARALGMTFGSVKALTEQNERFGVSVDTTISGLAKMQSTMADLSVSGSQLRQQMIGMGVPASHIDELLRETDAIKRRNMVIQDQIKIENDLRRRMSPEAAAEWANRYGQMFGVDPGARTRPLQQPLTEEEKRRAKEIEDTSRAIAVQWADILKKISDIKDEFLAWGLPTVLTTVSGINRGFEGILSSLKAMTGIGLKQIPILGQLIQVYEIWKALHGGGTAAPAPHGDAPTAAPPANSEAKPGGWSWAPEGLRQWTRPPAGFHPTSFGGANDNFGGGDGGRVHGVIKSAVFEALVEFYTYIRTGGAAGGGGGGGFTNASFGGTAGAAAAGRSGIPGGWAGAIQKAIGGGSGGSVGSGGAGGGGSLLPSDADMAAKDKKWFEGGNVGGGAAPNGSHVGAGAGAGAGETPASGGGGGGASTGDTSKVGNEFLASQRARLKQELDSNPELKRRAAAIIQRENPGAGTAVIESAMNRAAMTGRSLSSILSGGPKSFYGPARIPGMIEGTMRNMSAKDLGARYRQIDEAAAGSNYTKGATDQGSAGDPNYVTGGVGVNINRERFNDWGGYKGVAASREWRLKQQAQVNRSAAEARTAGGGGTAPMGPIGDRYSSLRMGDMVRDNPRDRLYVGAGTGAPIGLGLREPDRPALDRSSISRPSSEINSKGSLSVNVSAPSGTKVDYSGDNLLKATSMQRQTSMMPTDTGPSVGDTARSYMRGGS